MNTFGFILAICKEIIKICLGGRRMKLKLRQNELYVICINFVTRKICRLFVFDKSNYKEQ